jgi:hypothetical protein
MSYINRKYERQFFEYLSYIQSYMSARPLNLGGVSGPGGGSGGPPGGIIGYLPQTRVAYDSTEAATLATPVSGASLLDNLNHIRYRLVQVEGGGSGVLNIEYGDTVIVSNATVLNFEGDGVSDVINEGGGKATVVISGAGDQVKVSSDDTTRDYLEGKVVAGTNVTITTLNPGGNEQLEISASGIGGGGGDPATWAEVLSGTVTDKFVAPATTPITFEESFGEYATYLRYFADGGNIGSGRGANAIDLQAGRWTANDVPKAYLSTIIGGESNQITEDGYGSIIVGGAGTVMEGAQAGTLAGSNHQVTQNASSAVILGGNALLADNVGEIVHGWSNLQQGDAQHMLMVVQGNTTSATAVNLSLSGGLDYPKLPDFSTQLVKARVVARRTDTPGVFENAAFEMEVIHHVDDTGLAALIGQTKTIIQNTSGSLTWDVTFSGSNRNLFVRVTGEAGKTIRWVAFVDIVQAIG